MMSGFLFWFPCKSLAGGMVAAGGNIPIIEPPFEGDMTVGTAIFRR